MINVYRKNNGKHEKTLLLIVSVIFLFSLIYSKNLTKVSRTALLNNELLDVYIHNDYAFIPGGLGGLNIVDISDPSNTIVTGTYKSQNCEWGRLYSWSVFEDYAYGAGRDCGIEIIDISDISNPLFANNCCDPTPISFYRSGGTLISATYNLPTHSFASS